MRVKENDLNILEGNVITVRRKIKNELGNSSMIVSTSRYQKKTTRMIWCLRKHASNHIDWFLLDAKIARVQSWTVVEYNKNKIKPLVIYQSSQSKKLAACLVWKVLRYHHKIWSVKFSCCERSWDLRFTDKILCYARQYSQFCRTKSFWKEHRLHFHTGLEK